MKTVAILGSTGSIGKNVLRVIKQLKGKFKVVALATGANVSLLSKQINDLCPKVAAVMDKASYNVLKKTVRSSTKLFCAGEGVEKVAACGADIVVMAIGGTAALIPTLAAIKNSKRLALANKECLVMAGEMIMKQAKSLGVEIIPIDSEHSAIFQCLKDENIKSVEKIYLTGSGGPLKDIPKEQLEFVQPDFALRHPKWRMGKKISIDSATLMNKGLELIEARYLFGLAAEKIEILIHPQAIVHSLVQFVDGSILAQLGIADMRLPIQYALTYPKRLPMRIKRINLAQKKLLSFASPDLKKFPCLKLAMDVASDEGLAPAVLCACDEECVEAYLDGKIKITDFARVITKVLSKLKNKPNPSLSKILEIDSWAREEARKYLCAK